MSEAKAKLYKTAMVAGFPQDSQYKHGDFVSVKAVGKGAAGFNFEVEAGYLGKSPEILDECHLREFCI